MWPKCDQGGKRRAISLCYISILDRVHKKILIAFNLIIIFVFTIFLVSYYLTSRDSYAMVKCFHVVVFFEDMI